MNISEVQCEQYDESLTMTPEAIDDRLNYFVPYFKGIINRLQKRITDLENKNHDDCIASLEKSLQKKV